MARLSCGTRSGLDYQIEKSTDLHKWTLFSPASASDGKTTSFDVPTPHGEWFFHLAISPAAN